MWKESYKIGEQLIDRQHMELFRMTDELIQIISLKESSGTKENCKTIISFLKGYTIEHFKAEEAFQESIKYSKRQEHKKIHDSFIESVLRYEKKMIESDFDFMVIEEFAGTLVTWLIYHVAGEDQKIVQKEPEIQNYSHEEAITDIFEMCTYIVLSSLVSLRNDEIKKVLWPNSRLVGDISITVNWKGDSLGGATFVFTEESALNIFRAMTLLNIDKVNDLVYSALSEVVRIISDNAMSVLKRNGLNCEIDDVCLDCGRREFENSFLLRTSIGDLGLSV